MTSLSVIALLASEARAWKAGIWVSKPLASAGFVALALALGAEDSASRVLLAGLAACWLGDVLLIPDDARVFQAGIASFALGHLAYCAAFALRGLAPGPAAASGVLLLPLAWRVLRWLSPHVPPGLKPAVFGYTLAISAMVALAIGTHAFRADARIALGAVMFFASDLSVARDRFVAPGLLNRLWGLPLYYAAQLLLAWSVAG